MIEYIDLLLRNGCFINRHKSYRGAFTKGCLLEPRLLIWKVLHLVKKGLSYEVKTKLPLMGQVVEVSKQVFSKTRYKFLHTGYREIFKLTVNRTYADNEDYGKWHGYRIIAVDGSSVRLPESKEIVGRFGMINGAPLARVLTFMDVCLMNIVNATIDKWEVGERQMALSLLKEVGETFSGQDLIFMYDRGFSGARFIEEHIKLGFNFVIRIPSTAYMNIWERVNSGETDFTEVIEPSKKKNTTNKLYVRVVVVNLFNDVTGVLVTNLKEDSGDIIKLYGLRWKIEEFYKRLKVTAEIENFSGKTVESVLQDFWAHMCMINIATYYINKEQQPCNPDVVPDKKLNFTELFKLSRHILLQSINQGISEQIFIDKFKTYIASATYKFKPDRIFSRHKVGLPRRFRTFSKI
jgi:Transposase DDE domain